MILIPSQITVSSGVLREAGKLVRKSGIKVHVLLFPNETAEAFTMLAGTSGGKIHVINEEPIRNRGSLSNMMAISEALTDILGGGKRGLRVGPPKNTFFLVIDPDLHRNSVLINVKSFSINSNFYVHLNCRSGFPLYFPDCLVIVMLNCNVCIELQFHFSALKNSFK